jgi:signal transduction histidine kinase
MKTVVFHQAPKLNQQEERVAELHSILNILNVLVGELSILEHSLPISEETAIFERLADEIISIARGIHESEDVSFTLSRVRESESLVLTALRGLPQDIDDPEALLNLKESCSNIESVYGIVRQRMDEIEMRADSPDGWGLFCVKEFERQFREVFYAIEKNSKGSYRIFFNLARKSKGDYYIDLKVESVLKPGYLWIPMRLLDVMRDLTANARKYTQPGGKVALAIYQDTTATQILVEDTGCGIPEDELEQVVEFGYRASNIRDSPTMGGGLGLTKAAWLTHQWGGTLSIESGLGEGTSVRVTLPNHVMPGNPEAVDDFMV